MKAIERKLPGGASQSGGISMPEDGFSPHARIALYYAPASVSPWWRAGCAWLGRDAQADGADAPQANRANDAYTLRERNSIAHDIGDPAASIIDDMAQLSASMGRDIGELTIAPRRYGWHGTLVAPFRGADGVSLLDVLAVVRDWATRVKPFTVQVRPAQMGAFVALRAVHAQEDDALRDLAASALHALAPLRARVPYEERERRINSGMTTRQLELLREWDYPYVLDEFRFHMTLSDSLAAPVLREAVTAFWTPRAAALGALPIDGAALFVEPAPGAPFVLWQRVAFSGLVENA
jgi:hypothetical protein